MPSDAPPAPPPVAMTPSQTRSMFAQFPHIDQGGTPFVIMQYTLSADRATLEQAKTKLMTAGWPSEFQNTRDGKAVLGVGLEKRTLQDTLSLGRRLNAGEFGQLSIATLAIPDIAGK